MKVLKKWMRRLVQKLIAGWRRVRAWKIWQQILFLVGLAVLLLFVLTGIFSGGTSKTTEEILVDNPKVGVLASSNLLSGRVVASNEQYVYYDSSKGDLEAVYVNVGDEVGLGQPLAQYQTTDAQVAYDTAVRALNKAERQINDHIANGVQGSNAPSAATGSDSASTVDASASSGASASSADVTGSEASSTAGTSTSDSASAQRSYNSQLADLQDAYADALDNVNKAQTALNNTTVSSTIYGTVVEVNRDVAKSGSTANQTIVHIVNNGGLEVKGELSEYNLSKVKVGQEVTLTSKVYPEKTWTGTITYISDYPKEETATTSNGSTTTNPKYPFTIEIDGTGELLKQGFTVSIEISSESKGLLLPIDAVVVDGDKNYVWVYKEGRLKKVEVTVGNADAINQEILSGVNKNAKVIVNPQSDFKDGQEVKVSDVPHSD